MSVANENKKHVHIQTGVCDKVHLLSPIDINVNGKSNK